MNNNATKPTASIVPFALLKERYQLRANYYKALGHPTRLWIVESLFESERCVCEFVDAIGVDFSTISKHLTVLKKAGIIKDERRGKQVYYRLTTPCLKDFSGCIDQVLCNKSASNKGGVL